MNKLQHEGQVAIITGAASPRGIDWSTAKRCANEGIDAVVLDLDMNFDVSQSQRLRVSTQQGYDRVMNPSVRATFNMSRAALQHTGKRRVAEGVPRGRLDSAEDIADACLLLASDQSAHIAGVVLDVSGGMHIH